MNGLELKQRYFYPSECSKYLKIFRVRVREKRFEVRVSGLGFQGWDFRVGISGLGFQENFDS